MFFSTFFLNNFFFQKQPVLLFSSDFGEIGAVNLKTMGAYKTIWPSILPGLQENGIMKTDWLANTREKDTYVNIDKVRKIILQAPRPQFQEKPSAPQRTMTGAAALRRLHVG